MGRFQFVVSAWLLGFVSWNGLDCPTSIAADPAASVESIRIEIRLDQLNLADVNLSADFGIGFPFRLNASESTNGSPDDDDRRVALHPVDFKQRQETNRILLDATYNKQPTNSEDHWTSSHVLLDDVRVGDLAYVGLIAGEGDVVVRSLRVWINDQIACEETETARNLGSALQMAKDQAADTKQKLGAVLSQISDLEAFAEAGLASEEESQSLATMRQRVTELDRQLRKSEGVISGELPFFTADLLTGNQRSEAAVSSGAVSLITAGHINAETKATAFLQLGGKKFFLDPSSESADVTSIHSSIAMQGFQRFDLNLVKTPLVAADLRGFAIGLLGEVNQPSSAPDRWHLERMIVELDNRVVFDSDESNVDRRSLDAIRIVPPTFVHSNGNTINTPMTDRECALWIAGRGQGLDLVAGGPLPLPPADSPDSPSPEPLPPDVLVPDGDTNQGPLSPQSTPPGGMPLFPGEQPMPGWADGGTGGTQDPNPKDGAFPGFGDWPNLPGPGDPLPGDSGLPGNASGDTQDWGPWPGGASGSGNGASGEYPPGYWIGQFFDRLMTWLLGKSSPLAPGVDPPPFSDPFALETVRMTRGWRSDESMRVRWDTKGSAQEIDRYEVSLIAVHPGSQKQVFGPEVYAQTTASAIENEIDLTLDAGSTKPPRGVFFIAPKVVAVPVNAKQTPHERIGPARLVFPVGSKPLEQLSLVPKYLVREAGPTGTAWHGSVGLESPGEPAKPHVWLAGHPDSHNAILFADPRPGMHVVVRPGTPPTREIGVTLTKNHFTGRADLVGHVGFLGRGSNSNETTVHVFCSLRGQISEKQHHFPPQSIQLSDSGGGEPAAMKPIRCSLDTAQTKFNNESVDLTVVLLVQTERTDTDHPVALIGMALEPQP